MNKYTLVVATEIPPGGTMYTIMHIECEPANIIKTFHRQLWEEHCGYPGCPEPTEAEIEDVVINNDIVIAYEGHLNQVPGIGMREGA